MLKIFLYNVQCAAVLVAATVVALLAANPDVRRPAAGITANVPMVNMLLNLSDLITSMP